MINIDNKTQEIIDHYSDLSNEDYVTKIFECGTEDELEEVARYYNFTPEQIKQFCYFANLRRRTIEEMHTKIDERRKNNPIATEVELGMGAYLEN